MRILITRPREDSEPLAAKLRAAGHDVVIEPMLEIRPVPDDVIDLDRVQALLFTSANGVRTFAAREQRRDLPVFAVGTATAATAREAGFGRVESADGNVDDLIGLVKERLKPEDGVLFHAAGRDVAGNLAAALTGMGFEVRRAVLYAAEAVSDFSPEVISALRDGAIDLVLFYSPRTAETFRRLIDQNDLAGALAGMKAVAISPTAFEPLAGLRWAHLDAPPRPDEAELLIVVERVAEVPSAAAPPEPPSETPVFGTAPAQAPEAAERPQPAKAPKSKPAAAPRPGGRLLVPMVWLAVLLSLGTFILLMLQQSRPLPDAAGPAALRLDSRLTALERQAAGSSREPRTDPNLDNRLKQIESRIAALEARPSGGNGLSAEDSARISELDRRSSASSEDAAKRLEAVEAALARRPDAGDLAALMAENRRLAADLARVQEQLSGLEARGARGIAHEALLLAAGQLALAAAQGNSVAAEAATLRRLAEEDPRLASALQDLPADVNRRVPTTDALITRFRDVALAAVRASRRDRPSSGDSSVIGAWWDGVLGRLSEAVTIRRIGDADGAGPDARIAKAEQRLAARDLSGAVAALDGLAQPAAGVVADWLADARTRLALDRAVSEVSAAALAAAAPPR